MDRSKRRRALEGELDRLRAKYPTYVCSESARVPDDILAYTRRVVAFGRTCRSRAEVEPFYWPT